MSDLWNDGLEPPTTSLESAVRFIAETLLALGILLRASSHALQVAHHFGDSSNVALDVTYRLQTGFAVATPRVSAGKEACIRCYTAAFGFVLAAGVAPMMDLGNPLVLIAAANWGYLTADPLWFVADHYDLPTKVISHVN